MTQLTEEIMQAAEQTGGWLPRAAVAAAALLALVVVGRVLARTIARTLGRQGSARLGAVIASGIRWTFAAVGAAVALQTLGLGALAGSLLATGGLLAIVLGFAFRSIGENLLAGLFLGFSRAFEVGDLIESSGHTGVVKDIDLRSVHIRTADGRDIFVPCAQIYQNPLVNYTRDHLRRTDFVIGIDYGHDPGPVLERLLGITRTTPGVLGEPPPSAHLTSFLPQYQELRVLFWVDTRERTGLAEIKSAVMRSALHALRSEGIALSSDVSSAVALAPVDVRIEEVRS